jgi:capsular polysaccharide biosynthesis protein
VTSTKQTTTTTTTKQSPEKVPSFAARTDEDADPVEDRQPLSVLGAMWRYKGMCVLIVAVCVVLSAVVGLFLTPKTAATATIALKTPSEDNVLTPGSTGDASLARYTAQRARFVTSDAVLTNVARALKLDDVTALRKQLDVTPSTDSNIVSITATGDSGKQAVALATEVARAYAEETQKQVTSLTDAAIKSINESMAEVQATQKPGAGAAANDAAAATLGQLQLRSSTIRTNSALLGDGVEFVVEPKADSVVKPGLPIREAGLGFVIGLVVAATVAYLRADAEEPPEHTS